MKKLFLISLCLGFASLAMAYEITLDPATMQVNSANLPALARYDTISLNNGISLPVNPGEPNLPGLAVTLALPTGLEIDTVSVEFAEPVVMGGHFTILPAQNPTPIGQEPTEYVAPNPAIYSSSNPFPGKLVFNYTSTNMSGYALGSILFAPVQYSPLTGSLTIYRSIKFNVTYKAANGIHTYPRYRYDFIASDLERTIKSLVINSDEIMAPPTVIIRDEGKILDDNFAYVIITSAAQSSAAETLANWKTRKGLRTKVITVEDIETNYSGVDTQEKIRTCIADYYTNHATQYILLAGNKNIIPMRMMYDPGFTVSEGNHLVPSDNYYGCLDGTFNADGDGYWGEYPSDSPDMGYDINVGRVQTSSDAELLTVVNKTLCYEGTSLAAETNPWDYQNTITYAGSWLDSSTNEMYLMQNIQNTFMTSSYWTETNLWDTTYPGGSVFNASAFINNMNAGPGVIAHAAHSNSTLIGTNSGNVTSNSLYALTNKPRYTSFLYTLGCYDGNTDVLNNCAAYFVNAPNGGGVGFVGNTRYGWYSPGSPASGYSANFENAYFNQFGLLNIYVSGQTLAAHKTQMQVGIADVINRFIYYELYLTGDPDIWTPTDTISTLTATGPASVEGGSQFVTINVTNTTKAPVEGALVCIYKEEETHATGLTDASGNVSLHISPITEGNMHLTAYAHNNKPYEGSIEVTSGSTGVTLVSFSSTRITEGAKLTWRVSDSSGVSYFNLYRRPAERATSSVSSTGVASSNEKSAWIKINQSPITGRNPYTYIDSKVDEARYEYALEAVETTGNSGLGSVILPAGKVVAFGLSVAPNPVSSVANVRISLVTSAPVTVNLYDLSGRIVKQVTNENMSAGDHEIAVNTSDLAGGVYIVRLSSGSNVATKRMVVSH